MSTYAASTSIVAPVASPSSPSVRFTAFDHPAIIRTIHSTNGSTPIAGPTSAMNEMCASAGVMSSPSGWCSTSTANTAPTTDWPASLAPLRRPRLRCL